MVKIVEKLLRAGEGRTLKRLEGLAGQVNALEDDFVRLTDAELREDTDKVRSRHADGEALDDLHPEAFAAVREAAKRTLGQRHFDVQLIGGMVLHEGDIAEMKTGEGKTLVATLPAYLNALSGQGVHVVTVNDYLVRRDAMWIKPAFNASARTGSCGSAHAAGRRRRQPAAPARRWRRGP